MFFLAFLCNVSHEIILCDCSNVCMYEFTLDVHPIHEFTLCVCVDMCHELTWDVQLFHEFICVFMWIYVMNSLGIVIVYEF